jgi:hypothetical protein
MTRLIEAFGEGRKPIEVSGLLPQERLRLQLDQQVDTFLDVRRTVQKDHEKRGDREHQFLRRTFKQIIVERNERANDLASPQVQEAIEKVHNLLPFTTYGITCIDSRVMRTIMYGLPLGPGGFMRVPAGDPQEFAHAQGGGLVLRDKSYLSNALNSAFKNDNDIVELLDSHTGCAARGQKTKRTRKDLGDQGLYQDVLRKKQMASALQEHVNGFYDNKSLFPIQTSFDPHTGYLYMGLEKESVLEQAKITGFTPQLRKDLVNKNEIIYTGKLVYDANIRRTCY